MRKTLLLFGACILGGALFAQVAKTPLIEHFTQASCGPCATFNPSLKNTLDNFGTANYVKVTHQTSWPGFDPMNEAFPDGPDVRRTYYGVSGVPNVSLNGGAVGAPNTVVTNSTLQNAASQTTPYRITATQNWVNPGQVDLSIVVENTTNNPVSTANRLYVALLEENIIYPTAPGSNGETEFYYVMRQMYNASTGAPDATSGTPLATIAANSSLTFNLSITNIPTYLRDKRELSFAVYAQNLATREILQAAKSTASQTIPGAFEVQVQSTTTSGSGICDYSFSPEIQITNTDPNNVITSATVEYDINGGTPVQQNYSGSLNSGQTANIVFPQGTLSAGTSSVNYRVVSINGGQNWLAPADVDIASDNFSRLNATAFNGSVTEDLESVPNNVGYSRDINNAVFEASYPASMSDFGVINGPFFNGSPMLGGFGNSGKSVIFRFYDITSGTLNLIFQKVNLGSNSSLTFSHANAQYQTSNDRLEIEASTDCGSSWTPLLNLAGPALSTSPATNSFFVPSPSDWVTTTLNLDTLDNTDDVIIRFKGTSNYGNNLFIDDIAITSTLSSEDIAQINGIRLYPNPVTASLFLDGVNQDTGYQIFNLQGAQVMKGNLNATSTINVSELKSGAYFINLGDLGSMRFIKN